jgi:Sir2- and TIR-associating SLOG family
MPSEKRKTVFISGSAYEYGRFGDNGQRFIRDLSRSLLKSDFKIVTGLGSGVGNYIVEGALHEIYVEKKERLTDRLQVFPFPARMGISDNTFEHYRQDIISRAGVSIFLFGNKLEDITVREADGMWQEFEIAKSHHALLIPVGASGYTSEKIWTILLEKYDDFFKDREQFTLFERLGHPFTRSEEIDDLIEVIVQLAKNETEKDIYQF